MKKLVHFINYNLATGFGLGLSPYAPGTLGSLLALIIIALFFPVTAGFQLLWVLVVTAIAIHSAHWLAEAENAKDPSHIVVDEIAGQFVVFLLVPQPLNLPVLVVGFLLFRAFDIWKPWPVRRSEDLPGGWGIVMDDLLAGIYANLILQIWLRFF